MDQLEIAASLAPSRSAQGSRSGSKAAAASPLGSRPPSRGGAPLSSTGSRPPSRGGAPLYYEDSGLSRPPSRGGVPASWASRRPSSGGGIASKQTNKQDG